MTTADRDRLGLIDRLDPLAEQKSIIARLIEIDRQAKERLRLTKPDMSLEEFVIDAWPTIEPNAQLVWGWYLRVICEHLEAVTDGRIRNLVINIPPRFSKSSIVAVMWPCWTWTFKPEVQWLYSSYGADISERDSLKCRRLIQSGWYQKRYGRQFSIGHSSSSNMRSGVQKFENTRGGYRMATSVGGVTTGEGGSIIVTDDPMKAEDANSQQKRDMVNRWWDETMSSRLNDPKTGAKVIVMQRLHEDDLSGHVLSDNRGYEHLCLPMQYERAEAEKRPPTSIGFVDPRIEDGELLCPQRMGPPEVAHLRAEITEYAWVGQYQMRPAPRGGGMFRVDRIEIVYSVPHTARMLWVRSWDRAGTHGGGARTAGVLLGWDTTTNVFYIGDVVLGQWATDERENVTLETAKVDGTFTRVLLEQEPGSSGIDSVLATARRLAGFTVIPISPTGSKDVRAEPFATQVSLGNVKLLSGAWNKVYIQELENFPKGKYRDQVDGSTLAFNWIAQFLTQPSSSVASAPLARFAPR